MKESVIGMKWWAADVLRCLTGTIVDGLTHAFGVILHSYHFDALSRSLLGQLYGEEVEIDVFDSLGNTSLILLPTATGVVATEVHKSAVRDVLLSGAREQFLDVDHSGHRCLAFGFSQDSVEVLRRQKRLVLLDAIDVSDN